MKFLNLVFVFILFSFETAFAVEWIIDVEQRKTISYSELLNQLESFDQVIFGEKHDYAPIQKFQAKVIRDLSQYKKQNFTLAWEFLNWSDRQKISELMSQYKFGKTKTQALRQALLGSKQGPSYDVLLQLCKKDTGVLLPVNLSRSEKAPVVKGGITALDPKLLPPAFEEGSREYFERFVEAMGGHGNPERFKNYFAAQSLVDDVIAYRMTEAIQTRLNFLVIGSFHTAYYDGVYSRLQKRDPLTKRVLIHLESLQDYPKPEEREMLLQHPKYGKLADFIVWVE